MKTYIIAEAGVNHNGNINLAYDLIDKAAEANVDCIKFQTFIAKSVVSQYAEKAEYQKNEDTTESQLELIKGLELSYNDFTKLKEYAKKKDLDFCSTAFDMESIDFLHKLGIPFWKIPSGEITNLPYIIKIAKYNEPIILSTGMCNLEDIRNVVEIIRKYSNNLITVLHCNTEYPTPYSDVNLLAMATIAKELNCEVGYSDHTLGIEVPIAAVALGAKVIEKHFTLDKKLQGPDHKASLNYEELNLMVKSIRNIELALGDAEKKISNSEKKNIAIARKSIVANEKIRKGEIFSEKNISIKRPGYGISPMKWFEVIGKSACRDFEKDELIQL